MKTDGERVTRIVIVGASYGTIAAALTLRQTLPTADITFINRTRTFVPRRFVTDILAARATEHEHEINLTSLFQKHNIRFREDDLRRINTHEHLLELGSGEQVHTEYVLLDLPHEPHSADVPGAEYAYSFSGLTSAYALRKHLVHELELARDTNKAMHRTTIIVGAGVSGIESVCALRNLALEIGEKNFLFPFEIEHIIIDGHSVVDAVPEYIKQKISLRLENKGIEWYDHKKMRFSSEGVVLNDRELQTNTIVWTATPKGNRLFKGTGLAVDERGFAVVDANLKATGRVFAMGQSVRAAGKQPLGERTGDALIVEGIAVAENITASVNNKPLTTYTPRVDTVHSVAFDKRQGFGWFGPLFWTGALPVNLRNWREKRIAQAAQNI